MLVSLSPFRRPLIVRQRTTWKSPFSTFLPDVSSSKLVIPERIRFVSCCCCFEWSYFEKQTENTDCWEMLHMFSDRLHRHALFCEAEDGWRWSVHEAVKDTKTANRGMSQAGRDPQMEWMGTFGDKAKCPQSVMFLHSKCLLLPYFYPDLKTFLSLALLQGKNQNRGTLGQI